MSADDHAPRNASRFLAGLPADLHHGNEEFSCEAHNLSRSGVLLIGSVPDFDGQHVEITLYSGARDLSLRLSARVMRAWEENPGEHHLGLSFETMTEEQVSSLEAIIARVVEGVAPAAFDSLPPDATPRQIRKALDLVPLAHRIALAGRGEAPDREKILNDTNPQVLHALARNPKLVVGEMRALLRIKNLRAATLDSLSKNPKWMGNRELKRMVLTHPCTPLAAAERLVAGLPVEQLKQVVELPGLNPILRMKLGKQLSRKIR